MSTKFGLQTDFDLRKSDVIKMRNRKQHSAAAAAILKTGMTLLSLTPLQVVLVGWNLIRRWRIKCYGDDDNKIKIETEKKKEWKTQKDENWSLLILAYKFLLLFLSNSLRFGRNKHRLCD